MTDFRSLCAELVDEFEGWIAYGDEADCADAHAMVDRARAALAQPEPQGPTDEELITTAEDAGLCYPTCWDLRDGEVPQMVYLRKFARAVLARWGRPTSGTH
jgi:hypothetical protein